MRVVIVGAGQAGAALAAKLALGHAGEIVMLGDEPAPPYQRPPLSKAYLLGEMEEDRLWLRARRSSGRRTGWSCGWAKGVAAIEPDRQDGDRGRRGAGL